MYTYTQIPAYIQLNMIIGQMKMWVRLMGWLI